MSAALDELAHLREEVKQLRADAGRLDWMEKHPRMGTIVGNGRHEECYYYVVAGVMGMKLREIIDVARNEPPPPIDRSAS